MLTQLSFAVSSQVSDLTCLRVKTLSRLPKLPYLSRQDHSPQRVVLPTSCKRLTEFLNERVEQFFAHGNSGYGCLGHLTPYKQGLTIFHLPPFSLR